MEISETTLLDSSNVSELAENSEVLEHAKWFYENMRNGQKACMRVVDIKIINGVPFVLKSGRKVYSSQGKYVLKDQFPGGTLNLGELPVIGALREEMEEVDCTSDELKGLVVPLYFTNNYELYFNGYILKYSPNILNSVFYPTNRENYLEFDYWRWADLSFMIRRAQANDSKLFGSVGDFLRNEGVQDSINKFLIQISHLNPEP